MDKPQTSIEFDIISAMRSKLARDRDKAQTPIEFDIMSAIRSDVVLIHSKENIRVNATVEGTLAREPLQFYMLNYHRDRMLDAAKAFHWDTSPLEGTEAFGDLMEMLHDHLEREHDDREYVSPLKVRWSGPRKASNSDTIHQLRIAYSADGKFTIASDGPRPGAASIDTPPAKVRHNLVSDLYPSSLSAVADNPEYLRWRVFVSSNKVKKSLFTTHKTSDRRVYEKALAEVPTLKAHPFYKEVLLVNDDDEVMEGCITTPYFKRGVDWITPQESCGGNLGTTRRWALEKGLCKFGVVEIDSVKDGEKIILSNGARGFQLGIVDLRNSSSDEVEQE